MARLHRLSAREVETAGLGDLDPLADLIAEVIDLTDLDLRAPTSTFARRA